MKYILTGIFTLFFLIGQGQSIKEIKIWNSHVDAMTPHSGEVPEGEIIFRNNFKGEFIATHYYINKKRKRLKKPITIENSRIKTFQNWIATNKKDFKIKEIGIDSIALYDRIKRGTLTFEIENSINVKIDTFNFCNQLKRKVIYLHGKREFKEEFTFIDSLGVHKSFIFDNNINDTDELYQYILLYQVFRNKLSSGIPPFGRFNEGYALYLILTYLQTIECEEYYYHEYLKEHPEKTAQEKRMRTDWNFRDYMKEKGWIRE